MASKAVQLSMLVGANGQSDRPERLGASILSIEAASVTRIVSVATFNMNAK